MFDGLLVSMNQKLKNLITGVSSNSKGINEVSANVVAIQTTSDEIKNLISVELQT